jgi:hypothetical protein
LHASSSSGSITCLWEGAMLEIGNGAARLGVGRERRTAMAMAETAAILIALVVVAALIW